MKKLISLTLMLVFLLCATPAAYATEVTEPIEGSTPSVKTLDELQAAIEAADDGDQIQILDSIVFDSGEYCVGASDKTVELLYDNYSGGRELFVINAAVTRITLQNLSIVGNGLDCDSVLETSLMSQEVLLSNVTIQGLSCLYPICNTGVMEIKNCSFIDNNGSYGGHIRNQRGTLTVSGSTFVGGKTGGCGGAIYNFATLIVSDSVFENNYANFGGAIYSVGNSEITNSRIINNAAEYYSGGVLNSGLTSYYMVITDCEIYGNTAGVWADDISNHTKITIQYTKDISDIYTTTDRVPNGWQSDSSENRKGITDIEEYDIPIISTQAAGESLHLRFVFEDEIKEDNADDTPPTPHEDVPPEPSEPEATEPSEPEVTEPTEPSEPEITEPTTPSEPDIPDPTLPSEPETTEPTPGKNNPAETDPEETSPEVPTETTPDESEPLEESTPSPETPDDVCPPEEPDETGSTQPSAPEDSTVPAEDPTLPGSGENPSDDPNEPDDTETTVPSTGGAEDTTPLEPEYSEDIYPTIPESSEVPAAPSIGDDAESAEPEDTEDTPPVIRDDIERAPSIPDSTEPHIPPSDSQEETTVTEPYNDPSMPTEETEQDTPQETVPVTEPAPSNTEDIEQNAPPEETGCSDTPTEPDTHEPSNPVGEVPSNPPSKNIEEGAASKDDASTSSQTEDGRNQGYVEHTQDENGNTGYGEPVANASLIAEEVILKVNRIVSFILIISLIELGVLLVLFIHWLKRVRK